MAPGPCPKSPSAPSPLPAPVSPRDMVVPARRCCKSSGRNGGQYSKVRQRNSPAELGPLPSTSGVPHQPQRPSLKAVTAGAKARWFQQLVDAISQAALKGQVPLHNPGVVLTHRKLTLQAEDVGHMGVTQQPAPRCQGPGLPPSLKPSPQTHRPGTAAREGNGGPMHGAKLAQVGQVRRQGLRR